VPPERNVRRPGRLATAANGPSITAYTVRVHTLHPCCTTDRRYTTDSDGHIGWRRGVVVSGVRRMNEVNARRARLVLGWVTVFYFFCDWCPSLTTDCTTGWTKRFEYLYTARQEKGSNFLLRINLLIRKII